MMGARRLFCFGFGYTARVLAGRLAAGWEIRSTSREGGGGLQRFDRDHPLPSEVFAGVTHILVSIPPDEAGDAVIALHGKDVARISAPTPALPRLRGRENTAAATRVPSPAGGGGSGWGSCRGRLQWLGYLSTTGVYGDRGGDWVDENSELRPSGERGRRRVAAEQAWLDLWYRHGVPVHVFRLAGIYGPGRSPFAALRAGTARRIDRPGQVFSRIHVEDLASVLVASMAAPRPGAIYNACDDEPAAPAAVVAEAARLLGLPAPPAVPFERAALTPLAKSFWGDNKRVANTLIKQELGVVLRYPSYREGLAAILAAGS